MCHLGAQPTINRESRRTCFHPPQAPTLCYPQKVMLQTKPISQLLEQRTMEARFPWDPFYDLPQFFAAQGLLLLTQTRHTPGLMHRKTGTTERTRVQGTSATLRVGHPTPRVGVGLEALPAHLLKSGWMPPLHAHLRRAALPGLRRAAAPPQRAAAGIGRPAQLLRRAPLAERAEAAREGCTGSCS